MRNILFFACLIALLNACIGPGNLASYNGKEDNYVCFIAYETHDTLKGNTLTKKNKTTVLLDGKPVSLIVRDRIVSFQDKTGLYYPYYTINQKLAKYEMDFFNVTERLVKGRINIYRATSHYGYRSPGGILMNGQSDVSLSKGEFEQSQTATSALLEQMVSDYPPALKKLRELFPRPNGATSNDYPKMIQVVTIYNNR